MNSPRVAVIGCGHWGKNHVRNFCELGALAAVVDPDSIVAARLAKDYDAPAMHLEDALGDPRIDGVVIAAPAELHAEIAIKAFEAGKHVFVEKPISLTLQDAERMRHASEAAKRTLMVGHLLRFHPAFEALLEAVQRGDIGELRYAYSNRLSLGKFRTEENVLWSFAPHDVSMLLALFGKEPLHVAGSGEAFATPGVEDVFRIDMEFNAGRRAHVFTSWLHPFKEHKLVVVGESAMAVFEDSLGGADKLRLYRHTVDTSGTVPLATKSNPEPIPYSDAEPLERECQHFLDCCTGNVKPRTDVVEAMAVMRVLKAAEGSA